MQILSRPWVYSVSGSLYTDTSRKKKSSFSWVTEMQFCNCLPAAMSTRRSPEWKNKGGEARFRIFVRGVDISFFCVFA